MSPLSTFYEQVLAEALRRSGYKLRIVRLSSERALISANEGLIDGDIARILGLTKIYPNLLPVRETIFAMEFVLFAKKANFTVNGWHSLRPYTVAYITGWKIFEANIKEAMEITTVKNIQELFYLLHKDRIDTVAYNRWGGLGWIKTNKISDVRVLEPPLAVREMFLYLNRRHANIIPFIETSLRNMKTDGTYDRLFNRILIGNAKAPRG